MPDDPTPAERWDTLERDALYLLTGDDLPIWSVEDIGRALERDDAEDIVRWLRNDGLIYQTSDGYVFATRAAFRLVQMIGQVV